MRALIRCALVSIALATFVAVAMPRGNTVDEIIGTTPVLAHPGPSVEPTTVLVNLDGQPPPPPDRSAAPKILAAAATPAPVVQPVATPHVHAAPAPTREPTAATADVAARTSTPEPEPEPEPKPAATPDNRPIPSREEVKAQIRSAWGGDDEKAIQVADCESNLNPRATSPDGTYLGLWQFTQGTWESWGGKGDPRDASASSQTAVAWRLYQNSGWSSWGGCAGA